MPSPFSFTAKTDNVDDHLAAHVNALQLAADTLAKSPTGTIFNGKIVVSVATNNITVALKTVDGNDPSASDPVYVRIGDVIRPLTVALSVTKNAGTNWFASGAAELATKEIDYFVYIIWNTTPVTDILDIGFARIPHANIYSDFSGTSTNEKYLAQGNASAPNPSNDVVNIGRFAATLSATAGFNWSVPAFNTTNLIQRPIFETRWLSWLPTITGYSVNPTSVVYRYKVLYQRMICLFSETVNGTSNATTKTYTLPMATPTLTNMLWTASVPGQVDNAAAGANGYASVPSASALATVLRSAGAAWTASGGCRAMNMARLETEI